jgi:hypothetical protein
VQYLYFPMLRYNVIIGTSNTACRYINHNVTRQQFLLCIFHFYRQLVDCMPCKKYRNDRGRGRDKEKIDLIFKFHARSALKILNRLPSNNMNGNLYHELQMKLQMKLQLRSHAMYRRHYGVMVFALLAIHTKRINRNLLYHQKTLHKKYVVRVDVSDI